MSYLPDYYRAVNEAEGHDRNCGWGAGADCNCSVRERAIEALRGEYRKVRATTLDLTTALVGTTFPQDARAFDAAVTTGLDPDDCWDEDDWAYRCVDAAKALLDRAEAFVAAEGTY